MEGIVELKKEWMEVIKLKHCIRCTENIGKIIAVSPCEECTVNFREAEKIYCDGKGKHYHELCHPIKCEVHGEHKFEERFKHANPKPKRIHYACDCGATKSEARD